MDLETDNLSHRPKDLLDRILFEHTNQFVDNIFDHKNFSPEQKIEVRKRYDAFLQEYSKRYQSSHHEIAL